MNDIFEGKTILITGGTGFLGRALIQEILKFNPHSIRVFSRDEVKHHKLQEIFQYNERIKSLLGDVRDYERVKKACKGADIVIHAAALKRLDILEYNVEESIKTNILGTLNVVNACIENSVDKAVFVSTDKACSPVNTYGACKFVSERIFTESNYNKGASKTKLLCVRYGNVLESTGSVIPLFEEKILKNEPIPLTDERMTRFIITPIQAVELIFDALRYGIGGEVFVPIIPAFKITDLIELLKEKHKSNSRVVKIGIRPGEKLHEVLINSTEIPMTFRFKNLYVIMSCIAKYQKNIGKGVYETKGVKLNEQEMSEYCSKDWVLPKNELKKLFHRIGIV